MATLDQLSAWMCSDIAAKEGHSCISTVLEQPLVTCSSAPCSSDHSESDGMQSDEARDDVATWPEKKAAGWSARDATGASSARGGQHQSQPLQLPQQQSLLCTAVGEAGARPRRSTGDLVASLLARTCQVAGSTGSDLVGPGPGPLQPAPQLEPPPEIDGSDGGGLLTAASLRAPSSVPVAADATATWGLQPNPVDEARQLYSQSNPALHTSSPQRDSQADHLSAQPMDIDHETGDDAAARPAEEDTSRPDQQQQQNLMCADVGEASARPRRSTGDLVASLLAHTGAATAGSAGSADLIAPRLDSPQLAPHLEPPPVDCSSDGGGMLAAGKDQAARLGLNVRARRSSTVANSKATVSLQLQNAAASPPRRTESFGKPYSVTKNHHHKIQPMNVDHETGDDAAAQPAEEEDTSRPDQQQQQNMMCAAVGEAGARPRRSTGDLVASLLAHTGADTSATYTPINCTGGGDGLRRVTTSDNRLTQDAGGEVVNSKPASSPSWVARLPPVISCFASPVVMLLPFISPSALFENLTQNFSKIVEPAK